jgi:hypothetical protein
MNYAIQTTEENEVMLIVEDGGVAEFYFDGDKLKVDLYQRRLHTKYPEIEDWEYLWFGKSYHNEWDKNALDEEAIDYALNWLAMSTAPIIFNEVTWDELKLK